MANRDSYDREAQRARDHSRRLRRTTTAPYRPVRDLDDPRYPGRRGYVPPSPRREDKNVGPSIYNDYLSRTGTQPGYMYEYSVPATPAAPPPNATTKPITTLEGYIPNLTNTNQVRDGSPGVTDVGDPLTGFASRYAPGATAGYVWEKPRTMGLDLLQDWGMSGSPQLEALIGELAEMAPDLATLMFGTDSELDTDEDMINFMADYISQAMTPGGSSPDINTLFGNILGADLNDEGIGSPLATLLQLGLQGTGTAEDQVNATMKYLSAALGLGGGNPAINSALMSQARDQSDRYFQQMSRGKEASEMPFNQWLASRGYAGY